MFLQEEGKEVPGALGAAGQAPGGEGSPFSEKDEFPWTGGESSPL